MANPLDYWWPVAGYNAGKNLVNQGKSALNYLKDQYNAPYDEAAAANRQAGEEADQLGEDAARMAGEGISRGLEQTLPAARYWHTAYEDNGPLAGPGVLEQLYQDRKNGVDLDAERQRTLGARSIGNAFAARGLQNSGAALSATANMNADIDANHYRQMADLAAASQGATQSRVGGAFDRLLNLGQGRANTVSGGVTTGIDNYTGGKLGGIQSRLAASNVNLRKFQDALGAGSSIGGSIIGALA